MSHPTVELSWGWVGVVTIILALFPNTTQNFTIVFVIYTTQYIPVYLGIEIRYCDHMVSIKHSIIDHMVYLNIETLSQSHGFYQTHGL